ncbi:MAG TPA: hypothetical protein VN755_09440, partial [Steroidobacteraceae bacterium]|nr:hypothetical protein [Steroidobacteraceae bacterium]
MVCFEEFTYRQFSGDASGFSVADAVSDGGNISPRPTCSVNVNGKEVLIFLALSLPAAVARIDAQPPGVVQVFSAPVWTDGAPIRSRPRGFFDPRWGAKDAGT